MFFSLHCDKFTLTELTTLTSSPPATPPSSGTYYPHKISEEMLPNTYLLVILWETSNQTRVRTCTTTKNAFTSGCVCLLRPPVCSTQRHVGTGTKHFLETWNTKTMDLHLSPLNFIMMREYFASFDPIEQELDPGGPP